ncbi:15496_t:CDS:1, partial [Racocetra persica]
SCRKKLSKSPMKEISDYFEKTKKPSLTDFLLYRRQQHDFSYDKAKEHLIYRISLETLCVDNAWAKNLLDNFDV